MNSSNNFRKKTKEKIRNCKTEEEAMDILKQDMIPIPDDVLEDVAGGTCYAKGCYDNFCIAETCVKKQILGE